MDGVIQCLHCSQELELTLMKFCPECGSAVNKEELLIRYYFHRGFSYLSIISFLNNHHGIELSIRTLQNRLSEYGLRRRGTNTPDAVIYEAMEQELDGPGCMRGYRAMWHCLRLQYGIQTSRNNVERILRELDPEGTALRKAHRLRRRSYMNPGPNFAWHVDGYDKLKPYGFPIHGCVDGFSRRVMWLKVCRTNNDPSHVASFFYECVKITNGCPRILRTDCGTENGVMASMQCYLRAPGNDEQAGLSAHVYGSSHSNQRIERWWSFLRHDRSTWWINFFKDLVERNVVDTSNEISMECLWFCFNNILQADLDSVKDNWNSHYIRRSRYDTIPGRPNELYYLPENSGYQDYKCAVSEEDLYDMGEYCEAPDDDSIFGEYFRYVVEIHNLVPPSNWREALLLYNNLMHFA